MKIVTASTGQKTLKMSKSEWDSIGKQSGWMKRKASDAYKYLGGIEGIINQAAKDGVDLDEVKDLLITHIDYMIESATKRADSEASTKIHIIEFSGVPDHKRHYNGKKDDWGDPTGGPIDEAIRYPSYAEANEVAQTFDGAYATPDLD